jgi:hypothetical protein
VAGRADDQDATTPDAVRDQAPQRRAHQHPGGVLRRPTWQVISGALAPGIKGPSPPGSLGISAPQPAETTNAASGQPAAAGAAQGKRQAAVRPRVGAGSAFIEACVKASR